MDRDDPAYRGQADYSARMLDLYDPIVIGVLSRLFWRCPPEPFLDNYRRNITDHHLEIGPGTGYCVERSGLPDGTKVTILDPNRDVLEHTTRKLDRLEVTAVEAAVLKPNGTLFGATILGRAAKHSWLGHRVLTAFNRRGAFDNLDDTADGLREMLAANFEQVDVKIVGSAAVFQA